VVSLNKNYELKAKLVIAPCLPAGRASLAIMNQKLRIKNKFLQEILKKKIKNKTELQKLKRQFSRMHKMQFFTNSELIQSYHKLVKSERLKKSERIERVLRRKPIRSLSGIVNISVLTKPYKCPGKCIYCPSQKNAPKSYLKEEPAVQRAILCKYDPYKQVRLRIQALENNGHPTDKIELRIIGGTWSYYPLKYRKWFIKECFRACNKYGFANIKDSAQSLNNEIIQQQKKNKTAKHRIIAIGIETRPDYINIQEIKCLRKLGITKVELGVQSIFNNVLKINKRGHDIADTIKATRLLKNAGFKVSYQIMPNLLGSNYKRDILMFKKLFSNPNFKPDFAKIYPLALVREAPLYKIYKKKKFKPYNKNQLKNLLLEIKSLIPYYCRIERVIRDIPDQYIISGGARITNMRQVLHKDPGFKCKCIRCREVRELYDSKEKIFFFRQDYEASEGKEIFLSYENKKRTKLFSVLRLRINKLNINNLLVLKNSAIIRELHTYGQMLSIGSKSRSSQHKGLGKKLMMQAEKIVKQETSFKKIAVISGVGVRDYYRKLGYRLLETYMIKRIA
tara:strand:- start:4808 stop:6499 length:1692 start_codon:yes stop_codon:yes gene_type:complete